MDDNIKTALEAVAAAGAAGGAFLLRSKIFGAVAHGLTHMPGVKPLGFELAEAKITDKDGNGKPEISVVVKLSIFGAPVSLPLGPFEIDLQALVAFVTSKFGDRPEVKDLLKNLPK